MNNINFETSTEHAIPVAFLLVFGLIHRSLRTRGFILKKSNYSTDDVVSWIFFALVNAWTGLTLFYYFCRRDESMGSARLWERNLAVPWVASHFSMIWVLDDFLENKYPSGWRMNCSNGPFGWRESVSPVLLRRLMVFLFTPTIIICLLAIWEGQVVQAVLTLTACIMFILGSFASNNYIKSPHRYAGDMLRVVLPTSHIEGTVYVLPSVKAGFVAVWSPKVEAEHKETDAEMMALFASMRTGHYFLSEPLRRLRKTLSSFNERCVLSDAEVTALAEWLLLEPDATLAGQGIHALRPPNIHLIGRDLMFALAHAEYLVFMRKNSLPPYLYDQLGRLRETKRSGGLDSKIPEHGTIGYRRGLPGYQEAVRHVYAIFGEPVDYAALSPSLGELPCSAALGRQPDSTEDYVASLWTLCLEHSESTFSALYMFCCVWFIEVGNSGGFHIFPLRCESQVGDRTTRQILWRQGWYEAIQAQMIASSSLFAFGFAAGLFQR